MKEFRYLEHTADVRFKAFGNSLKELFENSAKALCNTMIDLNIVKAKEYRKVELKAMQIDSLLQEFLQEIVFSISTENMIFSKFELQVEKEGEKWKCKGKMYGEKIKDHEIKTEIKAVTYNDFSVTQEQGKWKALVTLDV